MIILKHSETSLKIEIEIEKSNLKEKKHERGFYGITDRAGLSRLR